MYWGCTNVLTKTYCTDLCACACVCVYAVLTHMAVEPWNATSSLFISLFGIIGILYSNPTKELRVTMLYILLIIIGLGSFALHASLHWFAQSLDELPMLWFNVYVLYFLCTLSSPLSQSLTNSTSISATNECDIESQNTTSPLERSYVDIFPPWIQRNKDKEIGSVLTIFAAGVTFIYYKLQSYYGVFVAGYIFTVGTVFAWTVALIYLSPVEHSSEGSWYLKQLLVSLFQGLTSNAAVISTSASTSQTQQKFNRMTLLSKTCLQGVVLVFGAIGFSCWLIDMHMCPGLLPYYTSYSWGMTLHVIWHMGAAYGGYLHIQTLIILRARALGLDLHIQWPPRAIQEGGTNSSDNKTMILNLFCLPILCDQKTLQKSNSSIEISCQELDMLSSKAYCSISP